MHIVYETTCLINGKKYIGVHNNEEDDYLGSGVALLKAVKRYGKSKFVRETLDKFDTAEEAYLREAELVTPEIVNSRQYYNIVLGGNQPPSQAGVKRENTINYSQSNLRRWQDKDYKARVSKSMKDNWSRTPERLEQIRIMNLGRKHTQEFKDNIRERNIKNAPRYQIDNLGVFTLREFCDKMGYNLSSCKQGVWKRGKFHGHTITMIR